MAAVFRGLELLDSAIGYAVASAELAAPRLLSHPTPCAAWDLAALLGHVSDSADALREAISAGRVGSGGTPREADPARQLRERLAALLAATAATAATVAYPPPRRPVAIGDRELTASMVILAGAMEIAVHGWDIADACGHARPVPPDLAAVLLATAPLLVTADIRPGLFAGPVPLRGPASPGDELVAFLGRRPVRGEFGRSAWSA
jgi:uncharacterized protein (TIGR03086 family)